MWGDSVSTDGTLFCSVATALVHAGSHATICRLLLAQEKFVTQTCGLNYTWLPEHTVHAVFTAATCLAGTMKNTSNNVTKTDAWRKEKRREEELG